MSVESQVAQAKSPQEAMLEIAKGLDLVLSWLNDLDGRIAQQGQSDSWGMAWEVVGEQIGEAKAQELGEDGDHTFVHEDEDTTEVEIPYPDEDRKAARRMLVTQQLKLDDYYATPDGPAPAPEGYDSWNEVYVIGGPVWLYEADRDCVMAMSNEAKRAMIEDVLLDSKRYAHEMARDILKFPAMPGPGNGVGPDPSM